MTVGLTRLGQARVLEARPTRPKSDLSSRPAGQLGLSGYWHKYVFRDFFPEMFRTLGKREIHAKVAAFIGISTGATHRLVRPKLHASGNDAKSSPPSLVNFVFSQLISPCCRITGSLLSGLIRTYVYVVIQLPLKQDS